MGICIHEHGLDEMRGQSRTNAWAARIQGWADGRRDY